MHVANILGFFSKGQIFFSHPSHQSDANCVEQIVNQLTFNRLWVL